MLLFFLCVKTILLVKWQFFSVNIWSLVEIKFVFFYIIMIVGWKIIIMQLLLVPRVSLLGNCRVGGNKDKWSIKFVQFALLYWQPSEPTLFHYWIINFYFWSLTIWHKNDKRIRFANKISKQLIDKHFFLLSKVLIGRKKNAFNKSILLVK